MTELRYLNKIDFLNFGERSPIRNQVVLWHGKHGDGNVFNSDLEASILEKPLIIAFIGSLFFSVLAIFVFSDIIGLRCSFPFLIVSFWFILAPIRRIWGSLSQHYFITESYIVICRNLGLFSYVSILNKRQNIIISVSQQELGYFIRFSYKFGVSTPCETQFIFKYIDRTNLVRILELLPEIKTKIWSWKRNEFVWWNWYIGNKIASRKHIDVNSDLDEL